MIDVDVLKNKAYYEENDDFKEFVDKFCATQKITPEVAFTHKQVTITREYYEDQ